MGLFSFLGFEKLDTLYYPGCMTYFKYKDNFELYKKIFNKLSIKVVLADNITCCGLPALELGYESEARKLARKKFELLKENNIKRIITNCPACYKMFTQNYPEFLPDWDIEVVNIWQLILEKLSRKPRLIKNKGEQIIGYHDSCYLGRYCGIYNEPRRILELLGYIIEEMPDNGENSICSGSCGSLALINPELADKIARQRLLQAKRKRIKKLAVASVKNYDVLRKNAGELDIEIVELSDIIGKALGIKIEKQEIIEEEQEVIDLEADMKIKEELKEEQLNQEIIEKEEI